MDDRVGHAGGGELKGFIVKYCGVDNVMLSFTHHNDGSVIRRRVGTRQNRGDSAKWFKS